MRARVVIASGGSHNPPRVRAPPLFPDSSAQPLTRRIACWFARSAIPDSPALVGRRLRRIHTRGALASRNIAADGSSDRSLPATPISFSFPHIALTGRYWKHTLIGIDSRHQLRSGEGPWDATTDLTAVSAGLSRGLSRQPNRKVSGRGIDRASSHP
jgi:hypothetical protein